MLQPVSANTDLPAEPAPRPPCASARCPLSFPAFRIIWIANLFANLGTWAQSVAAAWIITTEQSSPLLVAMIQVAAAFPLVALSILTGVLADNYDRRKVMLAGMGGTGRGLFITILASPACCTDHADRLGLLHRHRQRRRDAGLAGGGGRTGAARPRGQRGAAEQRQLNFARAVGPAIGGLLLGALGRPGCSC